MCVCVSVGGGGGGVFFFFVVVAVAAAALLLRNSKLVSRLPHWHKRITRRKKPRAHRLVSQTSGYTQVGV